MLLLQRMFTSETKIRVRYGETDQMGYVYYGNYATYFEVARVEAIRAIGFTYRMMEESGVGMPVAHMNIDYKRPAKYDDLITIKTIIPEMPTSKLKLHHEVYSETGELLTKAHIVLVFINMQTHRPTRCPQMFTEGLLPYFG